MKIALLGATGRTGTELMSQALDAGHEVVAYVRRPDALTSREGLSIVGGQLDDREALTRALDGCDAVAVALGPKISQHNAPIMATAVPPVIAAAKANGVKRVVVLSALGVGDTFANTRYPYRFGCRTFLAANFRDHVAGESQLAGSGLDWTTVHPGPLSDAPRTARPLIVDAKSGTKMPRAPRTRRSDVAAAMLAMIEDPATIGKQMLLTSAVQVA
ncbi:SDR family oxidoreductase [Leucobacter allii]|uniref:SDR family oxidoreductase n=1 Tax=Leucobacter allii TaxID=2932247 RepID=A0ABY4FJV5_9MICO|nr:NAD(P)-binding oxidoreductase [Leucobacter allii]UOQ56367.1 SDR family oxidoreductase [Leucobacter allii]